MANSVICTMRYAVSLWFITIVIILMNLKHLSSTYLQQINMADRRCDVIDLHLIRLRTNGP